MKFVNLRITAVFFAVMLICSCGKANASLDTNASLSAKNAETIRIYIHASEAYSQGRFNAASEILSAQKNFPPALILRTKAEYFAGDIEKAEKTCRRAIKLRPSSLEAKIFLARILREKGGIAEAAEIAEALLADDPQNIRVLRLASEIASETGKLDEAGIFLDKAAEYSAESAMVLLDRARLRWISGRANDALDDLSRAKAMLPWDTPLLRSINNLEKHISEVSK